MLSTLAMFRLVIVGSIALGILGALTDIMLPSLIPAEVLKAYEAHIDKSLETDGMARWVLVAMLYLVCVLVTAFGLFYLKRWARTAALWVTLGSALLTLTPAATPALYSSIADVLVSFSGMAWGAALAMAYFTELRVHFEPEQPAANA
jgi:hypothetical protein